ncbi:autophagy-related protein 22-like protein [Kockovaella imperatae]|uniref:Autophagy-related protein n=1 Tax=Kockovaella imperatae TaxID=4999 RepID=A0A1Y1USZ1_9TREE|nr:autophagy-related protein 22-like protein [Kockovaella imperatae]ORX40325.1 autophagy-related protein 22-like protein [Kockovaella imperatae]
MHWGGKETSTTSYILDLNGITFAVQLCILLIIGPYADYGTWRPYILMFINSLGIIVEVIEALLDKPRLWQANSAMYVLGTVCFNCCVAFFNGAFPGIVRDLPEMIESEQQVLLGQKTAEEHDQAIMMERSRINNRLQACSSLGVAICIGIGIGISQGIGSATPQKQYEQYAAIIGFFAAIWLLVSIPYFVCQKFRPGQKLPDGTKWYLAGPTQVWQAAKTIRYLKHTFFWIFGYFLIVDCYSTTGSIVNILQNNAISFSALEYSGLFLVVYGTSFIGYVAMDFIQRRFGIPPKYMFLWTSVWIVFMCLWGVIGIWTTKIGFHNEWEFWFYQGFLGLMTPGLFSYAPVILAEVAPAPKVYLFFALMNSVSQTSTFIGPFICGAIINRANGNTNYAFWFTFLTGLIGIACVALLSVPKAKRDCLIYLEKESEDLYHGRHDENAQEDNVVTEA